MKKVNLNEDELRKIVNKVLRRKINEVEEVLPKEKPKPAPEKKEKEKSTLDTENIVSVIEQGPGGIENLAKTSTNYAQRGGEVATATTAAGVTAAGTAAYLGLSLPAAAALAITPIGLSLMISAALAAGLYVAFGETEVKSNAVKEALDTTLYTRVAKAFKEMKKELRKSDNSDVRELASSFSPTKILKNGILDANERVSLVEEMYTATQGGSFTGAFTGGSGLFGMGTDETGVADVIKKCKSYLGVSQMSLEHAEQHAGGIIDDGNLLKVLQGEMKQSDFRKYVVAPIESLPFIYIGPNAYTKEEFLDWLEDTKVKIDKIIQSKKDEAKKSEGEAEIDVADYIKEIQKLLNQYCADKDLDHNPIKPDGKWGPRTNSLWLNPYLPHVFANHPEFSKLDLKIGNGRWKSISDQLIGSYPGYTSGQIGCYRFCKDALAGNTTLGKLEADPDEKPIRYFGGGSGKKRSEPKRKEAEETTPVAPIVRRGRSDGRMDYRDIIIDVDIVGNRQKNTIDSLPGAQSGDGKEFAYDFLGNFTASKLNLKNQEVFQLDIFFKGKDKVSVKNVKGTRLFKNSGIRRFKQTFIRYFGSLDQAKIKALGVDKKSPMTVSIKMPKGVYTAATERLHEVMQSRKAIKKAIRG